jgi:alpha-tubulin suppressor-like RCC1 family protein
MHLAKWPSKLKQVHPMKIPATILVACVSLSAFAGVPKNGVWSGTIGENPIMMCVEDSKAAYYYAGQASEIALNLKDMAWSESVKGATTGFWTVTRENRADDMSDRIGGEWRKRPKANPLSISLTHLTDVDDACSSAAYRQTLLTVDEAKLSLPLPQPGAVSAAQTSMAVLKKNGELWTWSEDRPPPKMTAEDVVQVAVGGSHTLAINKDGDLLGWGGNCCGQLGSEHGSGNQVTKLGAGYVAAAASERYSFAIRKDGTLWAWGGLSPPGKFDDGSRRMKDKPTLLGKNFVAVAAGDSSFAAIKNDGSLWMWGENRDGQLGLGNGGSWLNRMYHHETLPTLIGPGFSQVSVGYAHTAAIKKDGSLWIWGHGTWGKLGHGSEDNSPTPIKLGDGFTQVVAGFLNTAAVKTDGTLWLWGGNQSGMFGDCTTTTHNKPVQIGKDFNQVALTHNALLATRRDGSHWTWGWRWDGDQLDVSRICRKPTQVVFGDGISAWNRRTTRSARLALPAPPLPKDIASIAAGGSHSAMVKADGSLWTWGNNTYGQLGLGSVDAHNTPQRVGDGYKQVFIDFRSTLALKKDDSFWRWGALPGSYPRGDFLQQKHISLAAKKAFDGTTYLRRSGYKLGRALGRRADGTILDWGYVSDISKQPVAFGQDVTEISAGGFGSYAIKTDGSLWLLGQYPVNPPPKHVGNDFIHVVQNAGHVFGIKADGSLWAWGENSHYQLGDGTQKDRPDPVKIGNGFVRVVAGQFHGLALAADGGLWSWGHNETGVIGDGTTQARSRPVKIGSGFADIAAGDYHNLALKSDGSLWAWGNNEDGQLGEGTNRRRLAPVQVYPAAPPPAAVNPVIKSAITSVRTGSGFSCAYFSDEKIKCWGSNSRGQLGNPRHLEKNPLPILVEKKDDVPNPNGRMLSCADKQPGKACKKFIERYPAMREAKAIIEDSTPCALMKNGKVMCASGIGSSGDAAAVDGIDEVISFDYSDGHGCALQANGQVKCWGDNSYGQLGNGALTNTFSHHRMLASRVLGLD